MNETNLSAPTHAAVHDFRNEDFWRRSFPDLTILGKLVGTFDVHAMSNEVAAISADRMAKEGYFQLSDPELIDLSARLSAAISRCVELGIPPVFVFLFDEAWAVFHRQHQFISMFLGGNYQVLPDFWAWHVDPRASQAGWTPHRDKGRRALAADGSPLALTMWVPLTAATPMNGCMYMLPANRDPAYGTENEDSWSIDLASIRALPAQPGDFLIWNQAVLHWGAKTSAFAEAPRISIALEFQRADVAPFNVPLLGTLPLVDFSSRLRLVAKQILQYKHMYPLTADINALAEQLIAES